MARLLRTDHPGAWHHVMHRGARREPIFRRNAHCELFLECLDEAALHHGLEVHVYALMPNHYHLLARSPLGNLSRAMRHLNGTYTQRLNRLHGWDGPVFRGRFRSQPVEDEAHLDALFAYIHLNPFKAGLATRLDDDCWSSLRAYLGRERHPARWLTLDVFRERLGGPAKVEAFVRARRKQVELFPPLLDLETGWFRRGDEPEERPLRRPRRAEQVRPASVDQVLREVARIAGCSMAELKRPAMGRGANPGRRLAVYALSRAQAYPHDEIARVLGMSTGQVAKVLWALRHHPGPPLHDWLAELEQR
ncbi:MAG: transposase [Anaeromyxobacter sp.]